jgi:phosphatidylinositol-3-phosphatase
MKIFYTMASSQFRPPARLAKWGASIFAIVGFSVILLVAAGAAQTAPKVGHIFVIPLENEGYQITFGRKSSAVFLKSLARQGALLQNYYGIGHNSLDNYIAMISGQAPNPITQSDCQSFVDFVSTGTDKDGQALGTGCVYPSNIPTIANQLESKGLAWKGYMEDMGNDPSRESATCGHPIIGGKDGSQKARIGDQYATRHNPFVYFHSIIDLPTCAAHVVNLAELEKDLKEVQTTPNYTFITPNLCNDGHDDKCVDGVPGGLIAADKFLGNIVPQILASPAYKLDGLLIVTFDEADTGPKHRNATACCEEPHGPNIQSGAKVHDDPDKGPGIFGPGGGRIGAVLVSRFIQPGTVSKIPYNHYSLLRSIEDFFDLEYLGYAGKNGLKSFGRDVFTRSDG